MKRVLTLLTGFIFFVACNNNADQVAADSDSAEVENMAEEESATAALQQSFPSLFTYLQSQDSSFAAARFVESETSDLSSHDSFPLGEEAKAFASYFIYNADSSLALDLYSNNYILRQRGGEEVLQRGGPDTEIALLNLKKGTEQRLLFAGPSISVMDAKWISPQEIVVAGAEEIDNGKVKPMLWKVNLSDSTIQLFSYPDTVSAKTHVYTEERIKRKGN